MFYYFQFSSGEIKVTKAKLTSSIKGKSSNLAPKRHGSGPAAVRVHDLSGTACIGLSAELRSIFDKEAMQEIVSSIESKVMTVIIRQADDIAYFSLQIATCDLGRATDSASPLAKASARQSRI